ncbi:MAG: WYL domain-containing protein, partial [Firmicutes bacterium]|nr:WYL domain-containing protein [Bacillota bacterium]
TAEEYARIVGALENLARLAPGEHTELEKLRALSVSSRVRDELFSGGGIVIEDTGWGDTGGQSGKLSAILQARGQRRLVEFAYDTARYVGMRNVECGMRNCGTPCHCEERSDEAIPRNFKQIKGIAASRSDAPRNDDGDHSSSAGDESPARRKVEPYALLLKEGNWYLYGFCRARNGFRLFRLSRIGGITVGPEFEPKKIDLSLAPWNAAFKSGASPVTMCIEFDASVRAEVADWLGEDALRGETRAETEVYDSGLLLGRILGFAGRVRVAAPDALRRKVAEAAQAVVSKYDKENPKE